jgi:hypothetical protein
MDDREAAFIEWHELIRRSRSRSESNALGSISAYGFHLISRGGHGVEPS